MRSRFVILIPFLLASCTAWQPLRHPHVESLPQFYQGYYDSPKAASFSVKEVGTEENKNYKMRKIEFPLSLPTALEVKNLPEFKRKIETLYETDKKTANDQMLRYTIRIDYYVPKNLKPGEKRPAILISPILGGNMVVDHFAKYYTGRGYVAAIVHRKRVLWDEERADPEQMEDYLRTSVIRLRQAVDWLETQPEVDPGRIGAFGISYGAILHSVLAAVDPRVRYHVLAMPAGPVADVMINCPDRAILKLIAQMKEKLGWSEEKIHSELKRVIKTDPVYLAPYIPRNKIQIYVALFDRVVGAGRSFHLWRAMGKPKLRILPFGHYGGILVFPYLQTQSYGAFKRNLK